MISPETALSEYEKAVNTYYTKISATKAKQARGEKLTFKEWLLISRAEVRNI